MIPTKIAATASAIGNSRSGNVAATATRAASSSYRTPGVQKPNQFTRVFTQMKQTCPDRIKAYASCIRLAEEQDMLQRHVCQEEFAAVKECFREARRQRT